MTERSPIHAGFHAYTDGTDTIIGTSLREAITAYCAENKDADYPIDGSDTFDQLPDDSPLTIVNHDGNGNTKTMKVREWIDDQVPVPDGSFSRLLCSTEY